MKPSPETQKAIHNRRHDAGTAPRPGGYVLLAEDSGETRHLLTDFLQEEGYQVVAVGNGMEALNQMRWNQPCCIVLDMRMPVMTGWECRKVMKQDPHLGAIPVIGVTGGRWKPEDEADFLSLLTKPVDCGRLRASLQRCEKTVPSTAEHPSGLVASHSCCRERSE